MKTLDVQPPFIWPEPRTLEALAEYDHIPPFTQLVMESHSLFGIVTSITTKGVHVLADWLNYNVRLKIYLITAVYPACTTRQEDISQLLNLMRDMPERLVARLYPLENVTERITNSLCFLSPDSNIVHIATGSSENLGQNSDNRPGQMNFIFQADAVLVQNFKCYFDWLWTKSADLTQTGVARIPHLVLPEGTERGTLLWQKFVDDCNGSNESAKVEQIAAHVDPDTGNIKPVDAGNQEVTPPTEMLGLRELDPLATKIAQLYKKGSQVSIDKLSRIPPLDAPLSPSLFGDVADFQVRNIKRKVSMRVSVIDEKTLKEIDRQRKAVRPLLNKFTFALADNTRWLPNSARRLFESEVKRVGDEGQKLVSDLLKGDIDAFVDGKVIQLTDNINDMFAQLGRRGQASAEVIDRVTTDLKARLKKVQSANLMPQFSYSTLGFSPAENECSSPWGQAYTLLADIVAFPRKAKTDVFFFRGLAISDDELIEAMNVADDWLCRNFRARGIKEKCEAELDLLTRIEKSAISSKDRCGLVERILAGDPVDAIDESITEKEAEYNSNSNQDSGHILTSAVAADPVATRTNFHTPGAVNSVGILDCGF